MKKEEVIKIVESMGFHLDYDLWDKDGHHWLRFELKEELDEQDLRWIWYKELSLAENLERGAQIIFKAGQKAKLQQLNQFIEL